MTSLYERAIPVTVGDSEVTVDVCYHYTPECKAFTPRGEYGPIDPPEPPEVEIFSVSFGGMPVPAWFEAAASEAIHDYVLNAHDAFAPDPDDARESRRERNL